MSAGNLMRFGVIAPAMLILLFSGIAYSAIADDDIEVVANESVKVDTLNKNELKQILLTNQTTWKDGRKISIVTLAPDADKANDITREMIGMTSVQAKKYYLTKVFNGVIPSNPQVADTPDEVVDAVAKLPGAIAVVPKGTAPGKTKLIKVAE